MIVIPAVDIRDGRCVQLGSADGQAPWRSADPVAVARDWSHAGFRRLHVVDVDAAMDAGHNAGVIEALLSDSSMQVQVGGGVRDRDAVERLFDAGADRVVVGSRAIAEPDWLAGISMSHPGRVVVAADVRERRVMTRGWARTIPQDILDVVEEMNGLPLAGLLLTAMQLAGEQRGVDLLLLEDVAEAARFPVLTAGGVTQAEDLRALEHRGLSGAVIGAALYSGALDPRSIALEYAE